MSVIIDGIPQHVEDTTLRVANLIAFVEIYKADRMIESRLATLDDLVLLKRATKLAGEILADITEQQPERIAVWYAC